MRLFLRDAFLIGLKTLSFAEDGMKKLDKLGKGCIFISEIKPFKSSF